MDTNIRLVRSFKVYGRDKCDFCVRALNLLQGMNEEFEYVKLDKENIQEHRKEFEEYYGKPITTVPQIILRDGKNNEETLIGGFQELQNFLKGNIQDGEPELL